MGFCFLCFVLGYFSSVSLFVQIQCVCLFFSFLFLYYPSEACLLSNDRKGVNPDGSKGGKELKENEGNRNQDVL